MDTAYGAIALYKAEFQRGLLFGDTSDITVERSRVHHLEIATSSGDTLLFDNQLRYIRYTGGSGYFEAFTDKINGIWELESDSGDIYVGTRKWHQNLLLQLESKEGVVLASGDKDPWAETIPEALTEHGLMLLEGRGENMLCAASESGDIVLETVKFVR